MPFYSTAESVEACADDLRVLINGLDAKGYGDAADEIESALGHLAAAVRYLRAPEED